VAEPKNRSESSGCPASTRHLHTGRIPVVQITPAAPEPGCLPKAYENEVVPFRATVFREGHSAVGALLTLTSPVGTTQTLRMQQIPPGTDRWQALTQVNETGLWRWRVTGFDDEISTWQHDASLKIDADTDVELMYEIGARLCERAAAETSRPLSARTALTAIARQLRTPPLSACEATHRRALIDSPVFDEFTLRPLTTLTHESPEHTLLVERRAAGVGSWYEFFPRSEGAHQRRDGSWKSGTFRTAAQRLDAIAAMGFDVVYLPPIHPIGLTNRKGRNNSTTVLPGEPGSPWAIGGPLPDGTAGGHDAVHPDLGTLADFRTFVRRAAELGIEVALDLALQASPDHPWLREHPEWFTTLPDGTIQYAENPPKKYQDIYPLNFDNDPEGLFAEVVRIVRHWLKQGVRIFRVDNPHTKPLAMWERLIATIRADDPGVIFLAEAFTRPALMQALAAVGFQQSYSYFTWRNTRADLAEFFTRVSQETADFMRPNLFVNTPDILSEYLQHGGRAAFAIRATLAATAAPLWGVYSGFELCEAVARPGSEEAIDNEKYEYKPRDFAAADAAGTSLSRYLGTLNHIRREHPALGQLRNFQAHHSDDESIFVYTKHLDGAFTPDGTPDSLIIVVTLDPHNAVTSRVHLDLTALGMAPGTPFTVEDLLTGDLWQWSDTNYVRLDPSVHVAHILRVTGS